MSPSPRIFFQAESVPTNSCILITDVEEAKSYPRGRIELAFCKNCGFISNIAFDPGLAEYSGRYEGSQSFSPTFDAFHRTLAQSLIERHKLHGKQIVEIGCGNGEFLNLLCEAGGNRGLGFDPGYKGDFQKPSSADVRFINDFFSEKYTHHHADFIVCKMTLEHIQNTGAFVSMIRRSIGNRSDTIVFLQVPDVTRILKDCSFEDVYYEHCSYFSPGSLARLCRLNDFEILNLETTFNNQYLIIELKPGDSYASPGTPLEDDLELLDGYVNTFPGRFSQKAERWKTLMDSLQSKGLRAALWGSGSKAVAFITTLQLEDSIEYVVDINPHKQGHYMPGTAQKVVPPDFLKTYCPDVVVVMNDIYRDEIGKDLEAMGVNARLLALYDETVGFES